MTRLLLTLGLAAAVATGTLCLTYPEIRHRAKAEVYEKAAKENHGLYVLDSKTGKIEFKWHTIIIDDGTVGVCIVRNLATQTDPEWAPGPSSLKKKVVASD